MATALRRRKVSELDGEAIAQIVDPLNQFAGTLDGDDVKTAQVIGVIQKLVLELQVGPELDSEREPEGTSGFGLNEDESTKWVEAQYHRLELSLGARERAQEKGKRWIGDKFLSLDGTRWLANLASNHVSRAGSGGCFMLVNLVMLCLASILSDEKNQLHIIPEDRWLRTVQRGHAKYPSQLTFGYLLQRYPSELSDIVLREYPELLCLRPNSKPSTTLYIVDVTCPQGLVGNINQEVQKTAAYICQLFGITYLKGALTSGEYWVLFAYQAAAEHGSPQYGRSTIFDIGQNMEDLEFIVGLFIDCVQFPECLDYAGQQCLTVR
ncbi:hypothetical protein AX16_005481 [Volvariella volvacea WC 439]|nr:hypothetical protein AX16_005481 [Volvariella volvacea WC 439]